MYLSYNNKLRNNKIKFKEFILLRIVRLYPTFFIVIVCSSIFLTLINHFDGLLKHILIDLTFTQSWWGSTDIAFTPIDGPSWSVSTEFLFYILFYFIFRYIPLRISSYLFIFYFFIWLIVISYYSVDLKYHQFQWLYYVNPYFRFCDFWIGCFFAMIYLCYYDTIASVLLKSKFFSSFIEIFLIIILFASQYFFPCTKNWWILSVLNIFCGLIIILLSCGYGVISRIFSTRVFMILGESSYALYLVHVPLFNILNLFFAEFHTTKILQKLLLLFLPIILSIIIYKFIEFPINRYIRMLLSHKIN